jgi:hypothetical protein
MLSSEQPRTKTSTPFGAAEEVQIFRRGDQIEVSKFDKEARQYYLVVVDAKQFGRYLSDALHLHEAQPNLSEQQRRFVQHHHTPAEQRIVSDPSYAQAVSELQRKDRASFSAERTAILQAATKSHLEPYDYELSLRHQAFNEALRTRTDINQAVDRIDWLKDIAPVQYRAQIMRDPRFTPERSGHPGWRQTAGAEPEFPEQSERTETRQEAKSGPVTRSTADRVAATLNVNQFQSERQHLPANLSQAERGSASPPGFDVLSATGVRDQLKSVGVRSITRLAQTDSGIYRGEVVAHTELHILQQINPKTIIAHPKNTFVKVPEVGQNVLIRYSNAAARVQDLTTPRHERHLGR